jgi:hypothetical protein
MGAPFLIHEQHAHQLGALIDLQKRGVITTQQFDLLFNRWCKGEFDSIVLRVIAMGLHSAFCADMIQEFLSIALPSLKTQSASLSSSVPVSAATANPQPSKVSRAPAATKRRAVASESTLDGEPKRKVAKRALSQRASGNPVSTTASLIPGTAHAAAAAAALGLPHQNLQSSSAGSAPAGNGDQGTAGGDGQEDSSRRRIRRLPQRYVEEVVNEESASAAASAPTLAGRTTPPPASLSLLDHRDRLTSPSHVADSPSLLHAGSFADTNSHNLMSHMEL